MIDIFIILLATAKNVIETPLPEATQTNHIISPMAPMASKIAQNKQRISRDQRKSMHHKTNHPQK